MEMNRKARIIGLSAILAVLLVGLGVLAWKLLAPKMNGTDVLTAEGQVYTEKAISLKEDALYMGPVSVSSSIFTWDGEPACLDGVNVVNMATGKTVASLPANLNIKGLDGSYIYIGTAKIIHVIYFNPATGALSMQRYSMDGDAESDEIPLPEWGGSVHKTTDKGEPYANISQIEADENYVYIISYHDTGSILQIFTREGKLYAEYSDAKGFDISGDGAVYIVGTGDGMLRKIDVADKTELFVGKIKSLTAQTRNFKVAAQGKNGAVYVMAEDDITTYSAENGMFANSVFKFSRDARELKVANVRGLFVTEDGTMYMKASDDKGAPCYFVYSLGEDVRKNMTETFTITAPYRDEFMEKTIALYEKKNPDKKVKYEYTFNNKSEFYNRTDQFYEKFDLRLMTGDFGDIVQSPASEIMPKLRADVFADLKPMFEKSEISSEVYQNLFKGLEYDGKMRAVPLTADYCVVEINTVLLEKIGATLDENSTWSDLLALVEVLEEKAPDCGLFGVENAGYFEQYFTRMLIDNAHDLIDVDNKKMDLRQPWFLDLLKQWKKASESPCFAKFQNFDFTNRLGDNALVHIEWTERAISDTIGNLSTYSTMEGRKSRFIPRFRGEKSTVRVADSVDTYAINNSSKNKDAAWEFLEFAMSEEIQMNVPATFPVNIRARDKMIDVAEKRYVAKNGEAAVNTVSDLRVIFDSVDIMYDFGYYKEDMWRALLEYVDGNASLDEALKQAEHDIWIRMNE